MDLYLLGALSQNKNAHLKRVCVFVLGERVTRFKPESARCVG